MPAEIHTPNQTKSARKLSWQLNKIDIDKASHFLGIKEEELKNAFKILPRNRADINNKFNKIIKNKEFKILYPTRKNSDESKLLIAIRKRNIINTENQLAIFRLNELIEKEALKINCCSEKMNPEEKAKRLKVLTSLSEPGTRARNISIRFAAQLFMK